MKIGFIKLITILILLFVFTACQHRSGKDVDAYIVINNSLLITNGNIIMKIRNIYADIEKLYNINPSKVKPYIDNAKQLKLISNQTAEDILLMKTGLIAKVEGISNENAKETSLSEMKNKESYKESTEYFLGNSKDGSEGKANKLKNIFIEFRKHLAVILGKDSADLKLILKYDNSYEQINGNKNWERQNFYQIISAGSVTILNKMIVDVRNDECEVLNYLHKKLINEK